VVVLAVSAVGLMWAVVVARLLSRVSEPRRTDALHPA
jgi:hypothetical protein